MTDCIGGELAGLCYFDLVPISPVYSTHTTIEHYLVWTHTFLSLFDGMA
jgi:hypothetical protein